MKVNKLFFHLELSLKELLKNKRINIIVILSLALGMLMLMIVLANINVFWVNVKNLYPKISENTYFCNVKAQHITVQGYEDIQNELGAICMGGLENRDVSVKIGDVMENREVSAVSENYLDFIKYDILSGRSITNGEIQSATKVCMLEESFLEQNNLTVTVGDKICLEEESFEIVGIYRSMDLINTVLVPASVFDSTSSSARNMISFFVQFETPVNEEMVLTGMETIFDSVLVVKTIEECLLCLLGGIVSLGIAVAMVPMLQTSQYVVKMTFEAVWKIVGISLLIAIGTSSVSMLCVSTNQTRV